MKCINLKCFANENRTQNSILLFLRYRIWFMSEEMTSSWILCLIGEFQTRVCNEQFLLACVINFDIDWCIAMNISNEHPDMLLPYSCWFKFWSNKFLLSINVNLPIKIAMEIPCKFYFSCDNFWNSLRNIKVSCCDFDGLSIETDYVFCKYRIIPFPSIFEYAITWL